jgi:hypothetical protein
MSQQARFTPALRRAIMRACPDFFALPPGEDEAYYGALDSDRKNDLYGHLLHELFDIAATTHDEVDDTLADLETAQSIRLAETLLPLQGIGEDCFWLNEWLGDRKLTDFRTLRDYDSEDHAIQEEHRAEANAGYAPKPYRGSLYAEWARLFDGDSLIYGVLYCAAGYLLSRIEESGDAVLDRLVPHRYVRGPTDGQQTARGTILDLRVDANGREEIYEELNDRFHAYQRERYEALTKEWDRAAPVKAWIIDNSGPDDPEWLFIFSDKQALAQVRLRHFLSDCRAIGGNPASLDATVVAEETRVARFLEEQYAEIEADFDPKIRKLRPRMKLVLPPHITRPTDP